MGHRRRITFFALLLLLLSAGFWLLSEPGPEDQVGAKRVGMERVTTASDTVEQGKGTKPDSLVPEPRDQQADCLTLTDIEKAWDQGLGHGVQNWRYEAGFPALYSGPDEWMVKREDEYLFYSVDSLEAMAETGDERAMLVLGAHLIWQAFFEGDKNPNLLSVPDVQAPRRQQFDLDTLARGRELLGKALARGKLFAASWLSTSYFWEASTYKSHPQRFSAARRSLVEMGLDEMAYNNLLAELDPLGTYLTVRPDPESGISEARLDGRVRALKAAWQADRRAIGLELELEIPQSVQRFRALLERRCPG